MSASSKISCTADEMASRYQREQHIVEALQVQLEEKWRQGRAEEFGGGVGGGGSWTQCKTSLWPDFTQHNLQSWHQPAMLEDHGSITA